MNIVLIFILILSPLVLLINKDKGIIKLLGPVIICYILGIALGNIPLGFSQAIVKTASEASVPLAIPLLLISTNFLLFLKNSKKTLISFILVIVSVTVMSILSLYIFEGKIEELKKLAAMMVGVYTGGTPNMSAIGMALEVNKEAFILLNSADVLLGAFYLLFIFTIGKKFYELILGPEINLESGKEEIIIQASTVSTKALNLLLFLFLAVTALGVSLGLSQLIFEKDNVAFIILGITSFGVAFSFNKKISSLWGSYELGEYFLLIFCISIGMMANINQILEASMSYLLFCSLVMFGSIGLHLIFCRLFKVPSGVAIITSVAGLFGPPFVAPVAQSLKNKSLIVPGISCGLIGYAIGNYLGLSLYYFLDFL